MWPRVMLLPRVTVRVWRGSRVLLVLHASGRAEPVRQVVRILGVAAAVLHTICTYDCAVETCRRGERGEMIWRRRINNCMSTLWLVCLLQLFLMLSRPSDSSAPFIVMQRSHCAHGKWEKLLASTNIWRAEQRRAVGYLWCLRRVRWAEVHRRPPRGYTHPAARTGCPGRRGSWARPEELSSRLREKKETLHPERWML